ncbi:MAG: hypothetical protein SFY68_05650 [Candidatus Sumerlaeia bacterium]|nr:hypothetical protein [Candidatus Sumerlaeia bacterium]
MQFPDVLWANEEHPPLPMIHQVLELFEEDAVILTDVLTNSIFFNTKAEELFGMRGEELVNRTTYSLLGFENFKGVPKSLADALLGEGDCWRGLVKLGEEVRSKFEPGTLFYCEASALRTSGEFIVGVLRLDLNKIQNPKPN